MSLAGSPSVSGSVVTLTLGAAVVATDTGVKVSYTKPATGPGNRIVDAPGNEAATFADQAVTNASGPVVAVSSDAGTDDTYAIGDTISFKATFGTSVTVTGTPRIRAVAGVRPERRRPATPPTARGSRRARRWSSRYLAVDGTIHGRRHRHRWRRTRWNSTAGRSTSTRARTDGSARPTRRWRPPRATPSVEVRTGPVSAGSAVLGTTLGGRRATRRRTAAADTYANGRHNRCLRVNPTTTAVRRSEMSVRQRGVNIQVSAVGSVTLGRLAATVAGDRQDRSQGDLHAGPSTAGEPDRGRAGQLTVRRRSPTQAVTNVIRLQVRARRSRLR